MWELVSVDFRSLGPGTVSCTWQAPGSVKCARKWSKSKTRGSHWVVSDDPRALTGAGEGAQPPSQIEVCIGEGGEVATLGHAPSLGFPKELPGQNGGEGGAVP